MFNTLFRYVSEVFQSRSLPTFIIIGAQKSGTSSLYAYLAEHPQLVPSSNKEVHFFDAGLDPDINNYKKGEAWYRSHFSLKKDLDASQKNFEASPLYLFNPEAPHRIYNHIPTVKIIAVLRNPTERAISQYFHEKSLNKELLPIYEAFLAEEDRLSMALKNKDYKDSNFIHASYKTRGRYKEQLDRYFELFNKEKILILNSEDLFLRTEYTLKQVFNFLEVDADYKVKNRKARNVSHNRIKVEPHVYEYLNDYFKPHNKALSEMLGKEFEW